jgi:hypothetical protein
MLIQFWGALIPRPIFMLSRFYLPIAFALITGLALGAAPQTAKKTSSTQKATTQTRIPTHISASRTAARQPAARQVTSPQTAPPQATSRKSLARKPAAPQYGYRQSGPTPDRYKEIQGSLISKGYLQGEPTGVWDQNSADAMKKFQTDQKMEPTGKITAKSLITLGLGPRDESAPTTSK